MTQWLNQLLLLFAARTDLPRVWGRFDHQRPSFDWSQMLLIAGAMALAIAAVVVWHRLTGRSSKNFSLNSPARFFNELSSTHGLKFSSRRLLKRLAAARGLANPALLFVEPKHFDTTNLPDDLKSSAGELRQLRMRLFERGQNVVASIAQPD